MELLSEGKALGEVPRRDRPEARGGRRHQILGALVVPVKLEGHLQPNSGRLSLPLFLFVCPRRCPALLGDATFAAASRMSPSRRRRPTPRSSGTTTRCTSTRSSPQGRARERPKEQGKARGGAHARPRQFLARLVNGRLRKRWGLRGVAVPRTRRPAFHVNWRCCPSSQHQGLPGGGSPWRGALISPEADNFRETVSFESINARPAG